MKNCPFCQLAPAQIIFENELAVAILDKHPVSRGHMLLIPKAHREDYFSLTAAEKKALDQLVLRGKTYLNDKFSPDGYNLGFNCGEVAGQTMMHAHCHLIPRYEGDTPFPRGGIRGAIPGKMDY